MLQMHHSAVDLKLMHGKTLTTNIIYKKISMYEYVEYVDKGQELWYLILLVSVCGLNSIDQ